MNLVESVRIEKAAADCGFEMTSVPNQDGLVLRSARFPETVFVRVTGEKTFEVRASDPSIMDQKVGSGPLKAEGYGELYALLRTTAARARTKPNRVADEFKSKTATMPKTTEAERLVVQRVGQGLFRTALLDYWQGRCCVTGLDVPELLRASHIKPWAKCESDEERLDVHNGLLLAPHVDALFDGGWISFGDAGEVIVSDVLPVTARTQLGVDASWSITSALRPEHLKFLAHHRQVELRQP